MTEPTYEELKAKLSQLEKEVETKKRSGDLIFKVGEKGGVSVYGLGRFPVTLYYEQWNRLLGAANDIKAFMEENKDAAEVEGIGAEVVPVRDDQMNRSDRNFQSEFNLNLRWVRKGRAIIYNKDRAEIFHRRPPAQRAGKCHRPL